MSKHGPTRAEHLFRLAICALGLGMAIFAMLLHGVTGLVWLEILLISFLFFGGAALLSIRALLKGDHE